MAIATIPIITQSRTREEDLGVGVGDLGRTGTLGVIGAIVTGLVVAGESAKVGEGSEEIYTTGAARAAETNFLAGALLAGATFLTTAFLATDFLTGATFLTTAFWTGATFLATAFLTGETFLATDFLATDFLTGATFLTGVAFLATAFFAGAFLAVFLTATGESSVKLKI